MKRVYLRCLAVVLALAGVGAAIEIGSLMRRVNAGVSLLMVLALIVAAGLATGLLAAALAPARLWDRWLTAGAAVMTGLEATRPVSLGRAVGVTLFAATASYVAITYCLMDANASPAGNDQQAYLITAAEVQRDGGAAALLGQLFSGRFAEANRHPLYIAVLSFAPTFEWGKRLSAAIGLGGIVAATAFVMRSFGGGAGLVCCAFLATNGALRHAASWVVSESLLVLLSAGVWMSAAALSRADRVRWGWVIVTGALLGLAWLTKGTALLLAVGVVIWIALPGRERWPALRVRIAWILLLLASFAVVASPLLVRNVRRFGQPFYNVNSYLLFEDEYRDPVVLSLGRTTLTAAGEYWRSHTLGEMAGRELRGLVWETFIVLRSLGPAPLDDARVVLGVVLAGLAVLGMAVERRRDAELVLIWGALLVPTFAWYVPIAAGERFILPLVVPVLAYAATGAYRVANLTCGADRARRLVLWGCPVWCAAWAVATWAGRLVP